MPDSETTGFVGVETYRKRPIEIEAIQFQGVPPDGTNATQVTDWILAWGGTARAHLEEDDGDLAIDIVTLEGTQRVNLGWFIVKGIRGEFYAVESEIFLASYDRVEE